MDNVMAVDLGMTPTSLGLQTRDNSYRDNSYSLTGPSATTTRLLCLTCQWHQRNIGNIFFEVSYKFNYSTLLTKLNEEGNGSDHTWQGEWAVDLYWPSRMAYIIALTCFLTSWFVYKWQGSRRLRSMLRGVCWEAITQFVYIMYIACQCHIND